MITTETMLDDMPLVTGGVGSEAAEVLIASGQDDTVEAGAADDIVLAGQGDDTVNGGAGNDLLVGEDGDDTLNGGEGDDIIKGGSGSDTLDGMAGADTFIFNPANPDEGDDSVIGFTLGEDTVALYQEDVRAATEDLPEADSLVASLQAILDDPARTDWAVGAAEDGSLMVTHPGGTITFDVPFEEGQTLTDLVEAGGLQLLEAEQPDDDGTADTGTADTGTADTGTGDTGTGDTGAGDTGAADTGTADTGMADTGMAETGMADTGMADLGIDEAVTDGTATDGTTDLAAMDAMADVMPMG